MAKKPAAEEYGKKKPTTMRISKDKVVVSFSETDMAKMARCLEKGEIRLTFKEVRATKLPQTVVQNIVVD